MSRAEKIAIPIIAIVAIWVIYSVTQPTTPLPQQTGTSTPTASLSGGAPDFTLPNALTGQPVTLSSFRGKVIFLEFMEPWCPHCQNMAPILANLYTQYGNNVVFISVSGPWSGATAADAVAFKNKYGSQWVYLYDSTGNVMSTYGVTATPTFFIIGKDGSILTTYQGEQAYGTLAADLTRFTS